MTRWLIWTSKVLPSEVGRDAVRRWMLDRFGEQREVVNHGADELSIEDGVTRYRITLDAGRWSVWRLGEKA